MAAWADVLLNPWVVGTGTGILGGLGAAAVTQFVVRRVTKRVDRQAARDATEAVVRALRRLLSEEQFPARATVEALAEAHARSRGLPRHAPPTAEQLEADLVREVMDSDFLPSEQKVSLAARVLDPARTAVAPAPAPDARSAHARPGSVAAAWAVAVVGIVVGGAMATAASLSREASLEAAGTLLGQGVGLLLKFALIGVLLLAVARVFLRQARRLRREVRALRED